MSLQLQNFATTNGPPLEIVNALLLDDSDFDRKRIRRLNDSLDVPMRLLEVPTIEDMCVGMDKQSFDLILIDYGLPQGDGLEALDLVQKHNTNRDAGTIMITGNEQTDIAVSAMKRGCSDFLAKPTLTPDLFRKSVVEVLEHTGASKFHRLGRTDPVPPSDLLEAFATLIREGGVQAVLTEAMSDAIRQSGHGDGIFQGIGHPDTIEQLLASIHEVDEFIFE